MEEIKPTEVKEYRIHPKHRKILADTLTPVSVYLKLRDQFPGTVLLESSDYQSRENSYSYIGCSPVASFEVKGNSVSETYPDQSKSQTMLGDRPLTRAMTDFIDRFDVPDSPHKFIQTAFLGYIAYDCVKHFDRLDFREKPAPADIPDAS
ncbi:MAG: anthranilate synthase component I family protein, partial [Flavobacteriales bacterium]|nr:anthranilate synthase component I family protein [Flavobacteriales bacterium]